MALRQKPVSERKPAVRGAGRPTKQSAGKKKNGYEQDSPSIRAKQANSTPEAIKAKAEAGEDTSSMRGYVRLGVANTRILTGADDLSDWSDEELERGQKKDKNGRFQGRPPTVVPKALHDEMVRRQLANADKLIRSALVPACQALAGVIADPEAKDKDKLKAVEMILDRVLGKNPQPVEVTGDTPWSAAIVAAVVPRSAVSDAIDVDEV